MVQLSWRKKLFIFFILVALVPIAISGWNMISITSDEFKSSTNEQLSGIGQQISESINSFFNSNWAGPLLLIKSNLEDPTIGANEKAAISVGAVKNARDIISVAVYFEEGGNFVVAFETQKDSVAGLPISKLDSKIYSFSKSDLQNLDPNGIFYYAPVYYPETDLLVMTFSLPVTISGAPKAYLLAKVDLTGFRQIIKGHYFNKSGNIYLIDESGKKLFDTEMKDLSGMKIVQDVVQLLKSNARADGVTNYTNEEGETVVASYSFPQQLKWAVIAEKKASLAYQAVTKIRNTLWYWVLLGLVLAVIGGIFFSTDISRPIIKLSKVAETITGGNFDIKVDYKGDDAIGVLGNTLETMSHSLKESFQKIEKQNKQLEEYNRTLEQKVEERTIQLKEKNDALENTLIELKKTQDQLIMQQKLASLGALTAGIAHEIKNPLNFVNNFAKLSVSLVDELNDEIERGKKEPLKIDFGYVDEILGDIKTNVTKISEHGTRADNIVKNMLDHSRADKGEFVSANVNKIIEEALNLSYHGMRNQLTEFNCSIDAEYDKSITNSEVNGSALSQVFINMFNNSFYAMNKKRLTQKDYEPVISVRTKLENDNLFITIKDNGTGMSQEVMKKVFEPFFTTKPTGEGTGLGMSLSYDIIAQMHHGKMTVESEEGVYTSFHITLPFKKS